AELLLDDMTSQDICRLFRSAIAFRNAAVEIAAQRCLASELRGVGLSLFGIPSLLRIPVVRQELPDFIPERQIFVAVTKVHAQRFPVVANSAARGRGARDARRRHLRNLFDPPQRFGSITTSFKR